MILPLSGRIEAPPLDSSHAYNFTRSHLYRSSRLGGGSCFLEGLGFAFSDRWGGEGHRAGRLEAASAIVVLAEVDESKELEFDVFFSLEDADGFRLGDKVEVDQSLSDTQWGTR